MVADLFRLFGSILTYSLDLSKKLEAGREYPY
jgi:hypothetical protein